MQLHANGSFSQDLLTRAGEIRRDEGANASCDIPEAAAVVVTHAVEGAINAIGDAPATRTLDFADAIAGAAFICFAASPLLLSLREEGHELEAFDVIAPVGLRVYSAYPRDDIVEIIHTGIDTFNEIIVAAREHRNIREWNDHIWKVMLIYVMTGREECLSILGKLYLALHNARLTEPQRRSA